MAASKDRSFMPMVFSPAADKIIHFLTSCMVVVAKTSFFFAVTWITVVCIIQTLQHYFQCYQNKNGLLSLLQANTLVLINDNAVISCLPLAWLLWVTLVLFFFLFNYTVGKAEAEAVHGTGLTVAS